jgi:hypothetical protein
MMTELEEEDLPDNDLLRDMKSSQEIEEHVAGAIIGAFIGDAHWFVVCLALAIISIEYVGYCFPAAMWILM